jgi:hypothetical protein
MSEIPIQFEPDAFPVKAKEIFDPRASVTSKGQRLSIGISLLPLEILRNRTMKYLNLEILRGKIKDTLHNS